ncbi:Solute carrier family 2, facilitated glucose transporter member 3 [Lamellibrachia satsuma]|nr:Solute carrier family 2, facilitated glucose transporter member 3 [Lamellibrachia satsuma]
MQDVALTCACIQHSVQIETELGGTEAEQHRATKTRKETQHKTEKKSIIFAQTFTIIGGIFGRVCTTTKSPELLMAARFFFGITSGIGNCLAPMFLTEITPYNLRGAFGTVHQLFITFGIFMSSIFGLKAILGTRELWPYLLLIEIVPAVTTLLVMPWLPESPRFLFLSKKNRKAAETALKFYRRSEDVTMDLEEMDTEHQEKTATSSEAEQSFTLKDLFGAKDLRRPLFIACALQVIQQFSGINAVSIIKYVQHVTTASALLFAKTITEFQ